MKKQRILHGVLNSPFGGVERYILSHWQRLDHSRLDFHLITRFDSDEQFLREADGATVLPVGRNERFLEQLDKILDHGYDCVHLHTSSWHGGFPLEELALAKKVPRIIVHAHSSGIDPCFAGEPQELLLARHYANKAHFGPHLATDFWSCSQLASEWVFPASIPKDQIRILHNGIEPELFCYDPDKRAAMRSQLGLENQLVLGSVGRLTDQKNPFFLLDIFRAVHQLNADARLLWVGDGHFRPALQEQAADLGDAVIFLGNRSDVPALMQAMDGFLLPSLFEGLPIVGVEAQGSGLPCFFADTIAREFPIDELSNFYPLSMPPSEWAEEILRIIPETPRTDTRAHMTAAGYDIRQQAQILERLYLGEV